MRIFALICLFAVFFSCSKENKSLHKQLEDFEYLMGSKTRYWNYVKEQNDRVVLQKFKALYDKNKEYQYSTTDLKIPKVVHFIWLGPKPFPPESVDNVRSWMAHHPEWVFKFWTDRPRFVPCHGMQMHYIKDLKFHHLGEFYVKAENWGEKSDILRYEILFQEGGVYVDHDMYCIKSFEGLHHGYDLYCGFQLPRQPISATENYGLTISNAVLGAKPSHIVVNKCIELLSQRWDRWAKNSSSDKGPLSNMESTIAKTSMPFTLALYEDVDKEGNVDIAFPTAFFNAQDPLPSMYAKHLFAAAWIEDNGKEELSFESRTLKRLDTILYKSKKNVMICILTLVLSILLFAAAVRFITFFKKSYQL